MTIDFLDRAAAMERDAKRLREAAGRCPMRTHKRKMAFRGAQYFERQAREYRTLAERRAKARGQS